jgi:PAS domain-containing protein
MEQGDLINLLENLLGPAAAGVAAPRQSRAYHDDEPPESYLDADDEPINMPGALHPSMTGLLSAVMPIGIIIVETTSGTVVRLNKMLLRMLGVKEPAESMTGRRLDEVAPALGAPDLVAALNQVAVTGVVSSAILTDGTVSSAGEPIYRRWTISPLRQGSRSYETLLVTVLDITEQVVTRRRMEEAVATAQEQARRLQEHSSYMQQRIRQVEDQASARLQQAISQHEERVRLAAEQSGQSLDHLRQLELQLHLAPDQKRQLEAAVLLANDGARAQLEQSQRELEEARQEIERLRREEGASSADSEAASADTGALATLVRDLTAGPSPAFDRAARIIAEALADACGIFLANAEGRLVPVAFYHREPQIASQLTSFYTQHPLQPGEGLVGQVVRQGIGEARESLGAGDMSLILPGLGAGAEALGLVSAVCAPLRGALEPIGAVLALTTRRVSGGSDRAMHESDLGALNLFAGAIALAAHNVKLAHEIGAADAQREAVFAGMTDGVAVYDRLGRLRHVNAVAEKLLSPPGAQAGARPMLQGFLDERGSPLSGATLPWMRALHGDGAQGAVERVIATWEGGGQRALLLKALPARDATGAVTHAVVILRPDHSQAASGAGASPRAAASHIQGAPAQAGGSGPRAGQPPSGASEAGEVCARVARAFGAARKRRIEVRLPQRKVQVAASATDLERAVASLIEAAAVAFPASAPLQMSLVVEPAESATSRPRRYSAGPMPEYSEPASAGHERVFVATIQLTGPQAGATLPAAAPYMEQTRLRANAFGGMAWVYDEGGRETLFLLRAPVTSIGR